MKKFFLDTNVILRLLLGDVPKQTEQAKEYFKKAKSKAFKLVIIAEVVLETIYVLEKLYRVPRQKICSLVGGLIKSNYLDVEKREVLIAVIQKFKEISLDYVDLLLLEEAASTGAEIITFDKKLIKARKRQGN